MKRLTSLLTGLGVCALAGVAVISGKHLFASQPAPGSQEKPAPAPASEQEKKVAPTSDPAIEAITKFIGSQNIDKSKKEWKTHLPKPPQLTFDPKHSYYWVMETNKGTIKIKLMPDVAPMHVSSCIYLNTLGFYDGLKFHRVIKRFMAQGGCPLGNGTGNPGYQMRIEIKGDVKHDKAGTLSTARTSDPNTDGSQFFLTFGPTPGLDGQYTVYGSTVEGLDVLKKIEECGKDRDPAPPTEDLFIKKGTIAVE
jgi:peptidyl-prolyl cis-trans isomerase B (cyclophilin B)